MKISIGIIECKKWTNYELWLKTENINVIKIDIKKDVKEQLAPCNGIILPGGEDIHPIYYNKPEYEKEFMLTNFNRIRDEFELQVLQEAIACSIPVLGICRGLQIANVFFQGTLIPDLKSFNKTIHSCKGKEETFHDVHVQTGTILSNIIKEENGIINSSHHQSVDKIGNDIEVSVISEDGVVEGIEPQNKLKSMLLVQWHPERLDPSSPFSYTLKRTFINEAMRF